MALSLVEAMQNYSSVANADDTIKQSRATTSMLQDKAKLSSLATNKIESDQAQETNFQGKLASYAGAHADTNLATTEGALSAYSKLAEQTSNPKELEYLRGKQTELLTEQATNIAAKAKVEEDQSTILVDQVSRALTNRNPEEWQKSIDLAPDSRIKQGLIKARDMHMSSEYASYTPEQRQIWDDRFLAQLAPMKESLKAQYNLATMAYKEKALAEKTAADSARLHNQEQAIAAQQIRDQAKVKVVQSRLNTTSKELIQENRNFSIEESKLNLRLYGDDTDNHPGIPETIPNPKSSWYNNEPKTIPNPAFETTKQALVDLTKRHNDVLASLGQKVESIATETSTEPPAPSKDSEQIQAMVEANGQAYEPTKYEYRVVNGQVQRKAK